MKEKHGHTKELETMQARPDMLSEQSKPEQTAYSYKGYVGIGEKHNNATLYGRNQVINNISHEQYKEILNDFANKLNEKVGLTHKMELVISNLIELSKENNFQSSLDIWATTLPLFPKNWKPPLRLGKTFDDSHLASEAVQLLRKGEAEIKQISYNLYILQINESYNFHDLLTFQKDHPDWADNMMPELFNL